MRQFLGDVFRWREGRQGTGYEKMLLLTAPWPIPFDCYLLRYRAGSEVPPHRDRVTSGRHYRLNVILRSAGEGGAFLSSQTIFATKRIKFFRPDLCEHSVTRVSGATRYVFSVGFVLGRTR